MGGPSSGRVTRAAVEWLGTVECREEGCERQVSPLSHRRLCNTHHKRWARWNLGGPPALPKHVSEREAYPFRDWLASIWAKTNTVHCPTKVRFVDGVTGADEGWISAPLCNTDGRLRPAGSETGWSSEAKRCARCTAMLRRCGLAD